MEIIKIVTFVLGMFFGTEIDTVIAEKTKITVNPKEKTICIAQTNLLAIYPQGKDSITIAKEFSTIYEKKENWSTHLSSFTERSIVYTSKNKQLNATISLHYNDVKDLNIFAIDTNPEGQFSVINIPDWNLSTSDGKLNGNYWNFDTSKEFSFTFSPIKNVPKKYIINTTILHSVYQELIRK